MPSPNLRCGMAILAPHIRRAIACREAHFVRSGGTIRFFAEIDEKPIVELQSALFRIRVDLQHDRSLLSNVRIELVIPSAEKRVGHIKPLAVEAELQHLRAAGRRLAMNLR